MKRAKLINILLAVIFVLGSGLGTVQPVSAYGNIEMLTPTIQLNNADFSDNLTGWDVSLANKVKVANSFSYGSTYYILPLTGHNMAILTAGTVDTFTTLSQSFTAVEGDVVGGWACFASADYSKYNDYAQVVLKDAEGNEVSELYYSDTTKVGGVARGGWKPWKYTFSEAGTYTIEARVTNIKDSSNSSSLCIDGIGTEVPAVDVYSLILAPTTYGNVVVTDSSGNTVDANNEYFAYGTVLTLTAYPEFGYIFTWFLGNVYTNRNPTSVTMTSDKYVKTTFAEGIQPYTLDVTVGSGGSVNVSANGESMSPTITDSVYSYSITPDASVTMQAVADSGYQFDSWSGDIENLTDTIEFTMSDNMTIAASFSEIPFHNLEIIITGAGNVSVFVDDASIDPIDAAENPNLYSVSDRANVTLMAVPENGYILDSWGIDVSDTVNPVSFVMDGDKTVSALFVEEEIADNYTLTLTTFGGGSVTVSLENGTSADPTESVFDNGTVLTLTAVPESGYEFSTWGGSLADSTNPTTLTMDGNKVISATFTAIVPVPEYTLSLDYEAYRGSVTVTYDGAITDPTTTTFPENSTVTLTATGNTGFIFSNWSGDLTGTDSPVDLFMDSDKTVSAEFSISYTLQVSTEGKGTAAVYDAEDQVIEPSSIEDNSQYYIFFPEEYFKIVPTADSGYAFLNWLHDNTTSETPLEGTIDGDLDILALFTDDYTVEVSQTGEGTVSYTPIKDIYQYGETIDISATPAIGYYFDNWSGTYEGTDGAATVTITHDNNIVANFTPYEYTLTVDQTGKGAVAFDPDQDTYHYGDIVTLTAEADPGYTFDSFSENVVDNKITIYDNTTISATFTQDEYTLTVTAGEGGSVIVDPEQTTYHYGDNVTLTAEAEPGYTFDSFSENVVDNQITITGNTGVTAAFTQDEYTLTVNTEGNGTVTVDPEQTTYHYGDVVTLTAEADPGYTFAGFSSNVVDNQVIITKDTEVSAVFTQDQYSLTVVKEGQGSVTLDPEAPYVYGDVVTLTAEADPGYTFSGFTSDAEINNNQVTITGNLVVTAIFTQNEYTLTVTAGEGGKVTVDPEQTTYHYGDVVTLAAEADPGYTFDSFESSVEITDNQLTITDDTEVTAAFTRDEYTLTVNSNGNGTVTVDPDQDTYYYGDAVTLTAEPETGYQATWSGVDSSTGNSATVTIYNDTEVTVTFELEPYTLTITTIGEGSVTADPDSPYYYGDVVTLSATAANGYTFEGFSSNVTDNQTTITGNTEVTATFNANRCSLTVNTVGAGTVTANPEKDAYYYGDAVTLTAVPDSGYAFAGWSGDYTGTAENLTVTLSGDVEVTATFEIVQTTTYYTLTADANNSAYGSISLNPEETKYVEGSTVTLTADPKTGYTFTGWSGDLSGTTNPVTITMDSNKAVTANFTALTYTLKLNYSSYQGTVTASPSQSTYTYGTTVTLTATANIGYVFSGWSGSLTGTTNPVTITMDSNKTITAGFSRTSTYFLWLWSNSYNGTVAASPSQYLYNSGDTVTLTATPKTGYYFSGWSGNLTGTTNPVTITMDSSKLIIANFSPITYTLTLNSDSAQGSITSYPSQSAYTSGAMVTLIATPKTGYTFTGWSGDLSGSTNPTTITMDSNKSVTANFALCTYTLSLNCDSTKGTVSASPSQSTYTYGSTVTLTATPKTGYYFSGWSGSLTGTTNPATLTMNADKTVTANFTAITYTLTLNCTSSYGTVTASPSQSAYTNGTTVTLTATPKTGYIFSGWSGDLSGATNPSTITMDGNKTITANFTALTYTLTLNYTSSQGSATAGPSQSTYAYGTTVTLTATPKTGYYFNGWSGDLTGTTNPATLTMNANKSITATFSSYESICQDTHFVIWGGNCSQISDTINVGQSYTCWGSKWYKQVTDGDYNCNSSFKGYGCDLNTDGKTWTTTTGNSCKPPDSISQYIKVMVATEITKSGSTITGNCEEYVILKVDNPDRYQPDAGHAITGTIVCICGQ